VEAGRGVLDVRAHEQRADRAIGVGEDGVRRRRPLCTMYGGSTAVVPL